LIWLLSGFAYADTPIFKTGFEDAAEFSQFYITPHGSQTSTQQEISDIAPFEGLHSHRAWITRENPASTFGANQNHRAYPTIQLQKRDSGPAQTPVCVSLQVWAEVELQARADEDQWISLATFTDDPSDSWRRTVLINVSHDAHVHLQHVPRQGDQQHIFQSTSHLFPFGEWVNVVIEIKFGTDGYAKVWMNGSLVSFAAVEDTQPKLMQAHFGLYAAPSISSGEIRNDDLLITSGPCVLR
jgi:hypothetical protein